jgi:hypothetical protein
MGPGLTDFLKLEGYSGIARNEETQQLLSLYRLLRHLAEIPWLLERGFKALAERNITALQASLRACHHSKALPCMREHALGRADEVGMAGLMSSQPDDNRGSVRQSDAGNES